MPACLVPRCSGRKGKTGIATTFINKNQSEHILLDLKHLLKEAKQRIPPVLQALHDPMEELAVGGGGAGGMARQVVGTAVAHLCVCVRVCVCVCVCWISACKARFVSLTEALHGTLNVSQPSSTLA